MSQITATLRSSIKQFPDVFIKDGEDVAIGRNSRCKITDVRCPKVSVTVTVAKDGDGAVLKSTDHKTSNEASYKDGDVLKGPGYSYKVEINGGEASAVGPKAKKQKTSTNETTWEFDESSQVHIGKYLGGGRPSERIAAFDFDGTLSVPKSGDKFPKDGSDYKLFDKKLPQLISDLCAGDGANEEGHRFVIISNQLGIHWKKTKLEHVQGRIEGILEEVGQVPCLVFLAISENLHRKPRPGMFYLLEKKFNGSVKINCGASLYVGDAAGRKAQGHKDHSSADLAFAINVGFPFQTPEQFIGRKPIKPNDKMDMKMFTLPAFDPRAFKAERPFGKELVTGEDVTNSSDFAEKMKKVVESSKHVVLAMVGLAGSGKSTFFRNHLSELGFVKISRDELKTMEKCEKEVKKIFKESGDKKKLLIAVDNTNYESKSRKVWLNICKEFGASSVAVHIDLDKVHALHNNSYRRCVAMMSSKATSTVPSVPAVVIYKQAKYFEAPSSKEGFGWVFKVNFIPRFSSERDETLYFMFLTDK